MDITNIPTKFMDPATFPADIFVIMIGEHLAPRHIIRLRRISKTWHEKLTASDICHRFLVLFFPQRREIRFDMLRHHLDVLPDIPHNIRVEVECRARQQKDWALIFLEVARRYHNLRYGRFERGLKLPLPKLIDLTRLEDCPSGSFDTEYLRTWHRLLPKGKATGFDRPDPQWWYSQEDGLLVYPRRCSMPGSKGLLPAAWSLFDPQTGERFSVPFPVHDKVIRRVRLSHGVLVMEWAEKAKDGEHGIHFAKFPGLLMMDKHFATAFDAIRKPADPRSNMIRDSGERDGSRRPTVPRQHYDTWTWDIKLRTQWELPGLDRAHWGFSNWEQD